MSLKENETITVCATITRTEIENALHVLHDNGIDEDDAVDVLQAIGYTLIDTELFPEPV